MKSVCVVTLLLLAAVGTRAQVSCSPDVSPKVCKQVAMLMNFVLDHGILKGTAISLEIVTQDEYERRIDSMRKEDWEYYKRCADEQKPRLPQHCRPQLFDNIAGSVTFVREQFSASSLPTKVLMSQQQVEDVKWNADPKTHDLHPQYLPDTVSTDAVSQRTALIIGYLAGIYAAENDRSIDEGTSSPPIVVN